MFFEVLSAAIGLGLILKGSEWITDAVSTVARRLRTTNVAVGLLLVSLLLSLPELAVAVASVFKGHAGIGLGSSIGSVIVNLGLIIGIAAFLRPLRVPRHVVTRDGVFMLVATLIVATVALGDLTVTRSDGIILLLLLVPYVVNVYAQEKQLAAREQYQEAASISKSLELTGKLGLGQLQIRSGALILAVGGLMLIAGAELFTNSLISFASLFNISDLFIGLTIGALGPSIPNLAAALQASRRGFDELVVSEAIGSNIFTLLVTVGIIALLQPITIDAATASVTTPAIIGITIVFFYFLFKGEFNRKAGVILLVSYLVVLAAEFLARS